MIRQRTENDLQAAVRQLVDQAPPLTPAQRALIGACFRSRVVPRQAIRHGTPVDRSRAAAA